MLKQGSFIQNFFVDQPDYEEGEEEGDRHHQDRPRIARLHPEQQHGEDEERRRRQQRLDEELPQPQRDADELDAADDGHDPIQP